MNSLIKETMKKLIYILYSACLLTFGTSCEQEVLENSASPCPTDDPSIFCPEAEQPACPPDASAGSADFSKFVAIGTSYTAGFQAGALFTEGQNNSLGQILATQFECVGGGAFNQPSINSEVGYNIFISPNPVNNVVLGRFLLQGTPPQPAPVISGMVGSEDALPNPQANANFMYTGSAGAVPVNELNNFGVQALVLGQAFIPETGNWAGAGTDPRFNPFYARFASDGGMGGATLFTDAISSLSNGGTFFMFWLGMDDVMLHAAFGGDAAKAPLTPLEFVSAENPGFKYLYDNAINGLLANPALEGVIGNYPNVFALPYFTSVPWNAIPLDTATADQLTTDLAANYNLFLQGMVQTEVIDAEEAALRTLSYTPGQNAVLLNDETLTDLTPYMQGPYAGLQPYAMARQAKSTDILPLSAGAVLGVEIAEGQIIGVSVPLEDQHALIPSESLEITTRLAEFNAYIESVATTHPEADRLAFADVNQAMNNLVTARAGIANGITYTPNIDPPTGIYSEDGLHPNSRGYAFIANIFIDAINAKFGATVPKADLTKYSATALPTNP